MREIKHFALDGLINLRGYYLNGKPMFFASEYPENLTKNDIVFLLSLGISGCIDLSEYDPVNRKHSLYSCSKFAYCKNGYVYRSVSKDMIKEYTPQLWANIYIEMLLNGKEWIKTTLNEVANCKLPLIHCSTGKGRTSLISMCLLLLLGFSEEEIVNDFASIETYMKPKYDLLTLSNPDRPRSFYSSDGKIMRIIFKQLKNHFSDINSYLLYVGMTKEEVDSLRRKFGIL